MTTAWTRARSYIFGAIFMVGAAFFIWSIPSDGRVGQFVDWAIGFCLVGALLLVIAGIFAASKRSEREIQEMGEMQALEGSHSSDRAQLTH